MKDDRILRFDLSDGRHFEVPLGWLRAQLEPQGLHVITACGSLVLSALEGASERELIREQERPDWHGQVAGAELCRRKERDLAAFYARQDAHNPGTCEPGPKPTAPKPR